MPWTKRKNAVAIGSVILALGALVLVLEKNSAASVKDIYFVLNPHTPPNLVVIRPAHFVTSDWRGNYSQQFTNASGKESIYISGRGVSVQEMIGAAYGFGPSRIIFPSDMPSDSFDYLITVPENPEEQLQAAIKAKWGYTAHPEKRDTEVLALKVESSDLPGLQISTNTARSFRAGKLTRFNVDILVRPLEYRLKQPVVDETGLTNFYDFNWNFGPRDRATIDQMLADLGLGLETKTESLQMLVVEKAN
jgi:uncharacterized protein (TIGR03435 family)